MGTIFNDRKERDDEPWLPTEDALIIANFPVLRIEELAARLRGRSNHAVNSRKNTFKSFYNDARFTAQFKHLRPLMRAMILSMRETNYTIEDIAKTLKLKEATVYAVLAEPMMKKL